MITIHKESKNGKISKKVLSSGQTEKEAWDKFNERKAYLHYSDTTFFVAVGEEEKEETYPIGYMQSRGAA